jgi:hypothetical protein
MGLVVGHASRVPEGGKAELMHLAGDRDGFHSGCIPR